MSEPDLAVVLRHLEALDRFVAQLRTHGGRERAELAGLAEAGVLASEFAGRFRGVWSTNS